MRRGALIQSGSVSLLLKRLFGLKADEGPKTFDADAILGVCELGRRFDSPDLLFEQGLISFVASATQGAGAGNAKVEILGGAGFLTVVLGWEMAGAASSVTWRYPTTALGVTGVQAVYTDFRLDPTQGVSGAPLTQPAVAQDNAAGPYVGPVLYKSDEAGATTHARLPFPLVIPPGKLVGAAQNAAALGLDWTIFGVLVPLDVA